jgi:hypothetical protein
VPSYFTEYAEKNGHGVVNTGSRPFNNIANSVFSTAPAVSLIVTLFLDNTIPGTQVPPPPGSGLLPWLKPAHGSSLQPGPLERKIHVWTECHRVTVDLRQPDGL